MKKALLVILITLLLVCCLPTTIFAETYLVGQEQSSDYLTSETYLALQEFVTAYPDRSSTTKEKDVANYLVGRFASIGFETQLQTVPYNEYGYETFNAIGIKRGQNNTECIVIGAHYDSVGVGANDNASGIVALLQIAQKLKNKSLPFDVYFVAFGGEEQGLFGSEYFVNHFSQNYKLPLTSIRVMFNMDSIANGDNLYIHCENKSTDLANLILQSKSGVATLTEKPYAVGTFNADMWGYGYYETVQGSDHTPFRLSGIPVANFFSGNFKNWTYVESTNSQNNTMNTAFDKLENCNQSWIDKIDTVVATVVATVTSADFDAVSANARQDLLNLDFWYNRLWPKLAAFVIVIILAVLAVLHHRKLQKQALMGTAQAKTSRIFETPSAEDIFTFKD